MKNLLIYISPDKSFNSDHKRLVKIQIDNSLSLGWKSSDIILVTNFEYEYRKIKAILIEDDVYCDFFYPTTKLYTIVRLFKKGLIEEELYWYHDFDCYELNKIIESEVKQEMGSCNVGVSNYCQRPRLCSASIFFNNKAEDVFKQMKKEIDKDKINEERALMRIYYGEDSPLREQIKMVNTTYAFHKFNIIPTYKTTKKPIRVAHFHLTPDKYEFYIEGKNKLNMSLVPKRLIKIFNKHGFKR